jgi:alpha-1,2-glucosyltransferase
MVAASLAIHFGTVAHPYLLADNRHFTFYLWKDILVPLRRHVTALVGMFASASVVLVATLCTARGGLWTAAFSTCTVVVLVPSGLLELRYFTVPSFVAALQWPVPPRGWLLVQGLAFLAVNGFVLGLFCLRPFTWSDGSIAHFMW